MKILRYSLLMVAQLGLAGMCFAEDAAAPEAATPVAATPAAEAPKADVCGRMCTAKAFAAKQYHNGVEMIKGLPKNVKDLSIAGKNKYVAAYTYAPKTTVAATAGVALITTALTVYGIASAIENRLAKKAAQADKAE